MIGALFDSYVNRLLGCVDAISTNSLLKCFGWCELYASMSYAVFSLTWLSFAQKKLDPVNSCPVNLGLDWLGTFGVPFDS